MATKEPVRLTPREAARAIRADECPSGAVVTEGMLLSGRSEEPLNFFPQGLTVLGDLTVVDFPGLTHLSKNLTVHGKLRIVGCPDVAQISEGLRAESVEVSNCERLEVIWEAAAPGAPMGRSEINLPGSFILCDCPSLTEVPPVVCVGGDLYFEGELGMGGDHHLPSIVQAGGDMTLVNCPSVRQLGGIIDVEGLLAVRNCPQLELIAPYSQGHPRGYRLGGGLSVSGCGALKRIAAPMTFGTSAKLDAVDCPALEDIGRPFALPIGHDARMDMPPGCGYDIERCRSLAWVPPALGLPAPEAWPHGRAKGEVKEAKEAKPSSGPSP